MTNPRRIPVAIASPIEATSRHHEREVAGGHDDERRYEVGTGHRASNALDPSLFSDRLNRYWLGPVLGSGSTGTVRIGWDPDLAVYVAVKQMSRSQATAGFLTRYRAEAEVLVGVANPNVVAVYDYLELAGAAYLVMELVGGPSLRAVLAEHGRLSPEQSVGALAGALRGLDHVHNLGVIHRDVKPDNVLLDGEGVSKLVDFGLAEAVGTAGGFLVGTPGYASPEAIRGEGLDARSDLYSTGVVLFELLAGRPPFAAANLAGLLAQHLHAPPPTPRRAPSRLVALCVAAIAKDPAERPQSAAEMLAELEDAAREGYGSDWAVRSSLAGVVAAVAAGAKLAAGGAVAGGATSGAGSAATTGGGEVASASVPVTAAVAAAGTVGVVAAADHAVQSSRRARRQQRRVRRLVRATGRHGLGDALGSHPFIAVLVTAAVMATVTTAVSRTPALGVGGIRQIAAGLLRKTPFGSHAPSKPPQAITLRDAPIWQRTLGPRTTVVPPGPGAISPNSPGEVVTKYISYLNGGNLTDVCHLVQPSRRLACYLLVKILGSLWSGTRAIHVAIGYIAVMGSHALVGVTGTFCDKSGCSTNSYPDAYFRSGQSFGTLYAQTVKGENTDGTPNTGVYALFPCTKVGSTWYVTFSIT